MTKKKRPKTGRNAPFKRVTKYTSKAEANRWQKDYEKRQGSNAKFQVKQKGSRYAVYAQVK
jgi:hypothetical protein